MLNKVQLIGNVTRDIEMRYLSSGDGIANFSVATNRRWKDKNGERKEESEFHNITAFGALAKICGDYLKKGSKVYLEGRIKTESWEKDGEKKFRTVIIAEDMKMLDGKQSGGQQSGGQDAQPKQQERDVYSEAFDDDIPFESLNVLIRNHLV
jgi:single-strand DNA-binding protein